MLSRALTVGEPYIRPEQTAWQSRVAAVVVLFGNPMGYCPNHSTGVSCPIGVRVSAGD
jgi:hypothetical protein